LHDLLATKPTVNFFLFVVKQIQTDYQIEKNVENIKNISISTADDSQKAIELINTWQFFVTGYLSCKNYFLFFK